MPFLFFFLQCCIIQVTFCFLSILPYPVLFLVQKIRLHRRKGWTFYLVYSPGNILSSSDMMSKGHPANVHLLLPESKDMKYTFFAGAARRARPDSILILCLYICVCVCVSDIISRPLIGGKCRQASYNVARPGGHWGIWARRRQHICCSRKTRQMIKPELSCATLGLI